MAMTFILSKSKNPFFPVRIERKIGKRINRVRIAGSKAEAVKYIDDVYGGAKITIVDNLPK